MTSTVAEITRTLDLIERENKALKAFVRITRETALAEAALVDAKAKAGDRHGALHGLPIAVKDIIDVAGIVSGCGSLTQKDAPPAKHDAPVVARLRAAGAVVPGKTHTVEFAFGGYGTNVTVGTPWNPWDRKTHRIPGGSSSGSGVGRRRRPRARCTRHRHWRLGAHPRRAVRLCRPENIGRPGAALRRRATVAAARTRLGRWRAM